MTKTTIPLIGSAGTGTAGTGTVGTGMAGASSLVVDQKVASQEGVRLADAEVIDHLFPFLCRGSDNAGRIQNPIVPDEHFLSGPKFAGLQEYPAGQPDRVFRSRSKRSPIRFDRYNGRAGREEFLHAGLDDLPSRVDGLHRLLPTRLQWGSGLQACGSSFRRGNTRLRRLCCGPQARRQRRCSDDRSEG